MSKKGREGGTSVEVGRPSAGGGSIWGRTLRQTKHVMVATVVSRSTYRVLKFGTYL